MRAGRATLPAVWRRSPAVNDTHRHTDTQTHEPPPHPPQRGIRVIQPMSTPAAPPQARLCAPPLIHACTWHTTYHVCLQWGGWGPVGGGRSQKYFPPKSTCIQGSKHVRFKEADMKEADMSASRKHTCVCFLEACTGGILRHMQAQIHLRLRMQHNTY